MDTDKNWQLFGEVDPYFSVLTYDKYHSGKLTDRAREDFFQTGEEHVRRVMSVLRDINPAFAPRRTLDFGCGVGRLTLPLARVSASVLGVDVAPGMLSEARKNARERGIDNATFADTPEGTFDFVHTYIVLQHITPRRGMHIIRDLASRIEVGGMIALHVPYRRDAPAWRKFVTSLKRTEPITNRVMNLMAGREFSYPAMTMFCYDLTKILEVFSQAGIRNIRFADEPRDGYLSATLYGERPS